ncbi:MAG: glutamyl-tRNA reductase [Frankiales bacterium]|jgi:glutamyl-tRNA reductase|nr:glutamyl-tRNA reductase [Frankiales bacterium]
MSLLAVGLSHRSTPVSVLERAAVGGDAAAKLLHDLQHSAHVEESLVLSTCNRIEVYAEVARFHAGVTEITELLARAAGFGLEELTAHLYVHYEDRAIQHLFTVACGLDSMVVGESQILGQLRASFRAAQTAGSTGRSVGGVVQQALRVGKRVHTETGIDRTGASLVSVGLEAGRPVVGDYAGKRAVVVGAGSMGALAAHTLRRAGVDEIVVVNRSTERAEHLATAVGGRAARLDSLPAVLAAADVAVSCTGSVGIVIDADAVAAAMADRTDRPLYLLDLALPRDIDRTAQDVAGVTITDLDDLSAVLAAAETADDVTAAKAIVTEEVGAFLAGQHSERVAPTVVALRSKAAEVVDAELLRLDARLPDLDERSRVEVATAVRRVVDKLLHAPTVRVKELAATPDGHSYADILGELFGLDPAAVAAVTAADVIVEEELR